MSARLLLSALLPLLLAVPACNHDAGPSNDVNFYSHNFYTIPETPRAGSTAIVRIVFEYDGGLFHDSADTVIVTDRGERLTRWRLFKPNSRGFRYREFQWPVPDDPGPAVLTMSVNGVLVGTHTVHVDAGE